MYTHTTHNGTLQSGGEGRVNSERENAEFITDRPVIAGQSRAQHTRVCREFTSSLFESQSMYVYIWRVRA